ncbi:hypothetical protein EVAR_28668_1 [Eumeta japonica]|uniref:Uncharacterized protein n=1 Tax=Eumeta variegata TaxID=151549 RepID=A0A4C1V3W9_EUMVA|nr:hypothetical protein EVAR_28668_1 [Eumeta japonica]
MSIPLNRLDFCFACLDRRDQCQHFREAIELANSQKRSDYLRPWTLATPLLSHQYVVGLLALTQSDRISDGEGILHRNSGSLVEMQQREPLPYLGILKATQFGPWMPLPLAFRTEYVKMTSNRLRVQIITIFLLYRPKAEAHLSKPYFRLSGLPLKYDPPAQCRFTGCGRPSLMAVIDRDAGLRRATQGHEGLDVISNA